MADFFYGGACVAGYWVGAQLEEGQIVDGLLGKRRSIHRDARINLRFPSFYRSSAGAEIDFLLTWPSSEHGAIEVKRSTTPKVERGFYSACDDVKPDKKWVIYPGTEVYPLGGDIQVMPLHVAMRELAGRRGNY